MNECEKASLVGAYCDEQLSPAAQAQMQQHLEQCASCAAEAARLRKLTQLLRSTALAQPSAATMDRMHRQADLLPSAGVYRLARAIASVAAAILLICTVALEYQGSVAAAPGGAAAWEMQAAAAEVASGDSEDALAEWIVQDLSGKDEHE